MLNYDISPGAQLAGNFGTDQRAGYYVGQSVLKPANEEWVRGDDSDSRARAGELSELGFEEELGLVHPPKVNRLTLGLIIALAFGKDLVDGLNHGHKMFTGGNEVVSGHGPS